MRMPSSDSRVRPPWDWPARGSTQQAPARRSRSILSLRDCAPVARRAACARLSRRNHRLARRPHAIRSQPAGHDHRRCRHRHHGAGYRPGVGAGRHAGDRLRRSPVAPRRRRTLSPRCSAARSKGAHARNRDAGRARPHSTVTTDLKDMAKAHCVVEAIFERLDIKQEMFARLDEICGPEDDHRLQHVVSAGHRDCRRSRSGRSGSAACTSSIPCR